MCRSLAKMYQALPLHFSMGSKVIHNNYANKGEPGYEASTYIYIRSDPAWISYLVPKRMINIISGVVETYGFFWANVPSPSCICKYILRVH